MGATNNRIVDSRRQGADPDSSNKWIAIAAVLQAIPLILWIALLVLLAGFIGLAIFFHQDHNQLKTFTNDVLLWIVRILIAAGIVLLVAAFYQLYQVFHSVRLSLYEAQEAAASAHKQQLLVTNQEWKNKQLEARVRLEEQLPIMMKYAMEQG